MTRSLVVSSVVVPFLALAACGGGSGGGAGGGGGGGGGGSPPTVAVAFPPTSFLTDRPAPVRGTAVDPDGVSGVTVAGVLASTGDAFAHWGAVKDFAVGDSPLVVGAVDTKGESVADAVPGRMARRVGELVTDVRSLEYDAAANRVYALDYARNAILSIALTPGVATVLSGAGTGTGPALLAPSTIHFDAALGKLYVCDTSLPALVAVDIATGDRTIVSGGLVGGGPAMPAPRAATTSSALNKAWVADGALAAVVEVDLATGNRTILSSAAVGTGPAFGNVGALQLDAAGGRLLVAAGASRTEIYAVQLVGGDRTVVTGGAVGSGPTFSQIHDLEFDVATGLIYGTDYPNASVKSVVPATGLRTILSGAGVGNGPDGFVNGVVGLALDHGGNRVFIVPNNYGGILAADLTTGDRTDAYRPGIGIGATLHNAAGSALDAANHRVLVSTIPLNDLVAVDMTTGARSPFVGAGTPITATTDLAIDAPGNRLIALAWDAGPSLVAMDRTTGARTMLSGPGVGSGAAIGSAHRLALNAAGDVAYVADGSAATITRVALASGDRTPFADAVTGTGPTLAFPYSVIVHPTTGVVYVGDLAGVPRIVAIDPVTKVRTVVSSSGVGAGPVFDGNTFQDLAWDMAGDRLLVLTSIRLYAVDVATGNRTTLLDATTGTGPRPGVMLSLDLDPATGLVWILDQQHAGVMVADPATGDRVLVSK